MCKSFYSPCHVSSEVSAVLRSFQAFVAFCVSYADIVPMHIFPLPPLNSFCVPAPKQLVAIGIPVLCLFRGESTM